MKVIYRELLNVNESYAGVNHYLNSTFDFSPTANPNVSLFGLNTYILDGNISVEEVPFASNLSDEDCIISTPTKLLVTLDKQTSATGISFLFAKNKYPSEIEIAYKSNGAIVDTQTFSVSGEKFSADYPFSNIDSYEITFSKTAYPKQRVVLLYTKVGAERIFDNDDLIQNSNRITREIDLSNLTLPYDVLEFSVNANNKEYLFLKRQILDCYQGDTYLGRFYLFESKKDKDNIYRVVGHSIISVLDDNEFSADYSAGETAENILKDIYPDAAGTLSGNINGILPNENQTKRTALQQLMFATGKQVDEEDGGLTIYSPSTTPIEIPKSRIYQSPTIEMDDIRTGVRVYAHNFTQNDNGTIVVSNDLVNKKFNDIKKCYIRKRTDIDDVVSNVKEVNNATLISNGTNAATRLTSFYERRRVWNGDVVWQNEKIGDCVKVYTENGDEFIGNIEYISLTFSGIVKASLKVREIIEEVGNYSNSVGEEIDTGIQIASTSKLGAVKVDGDTINVDAEGVISANVQPVTSVNGLSGGTITSAVIVNGNITGNYLIGTWLQTTSASENAGYSDFFVNIGGWLYKRSKANVKSDLGVPTKTSELENDSGYLTEQSLDGYLPLTAGTDKQLTGDLCLKHPSNYVDTPETATTRRIMFLGQNGSYISRIYTTIGKTWNALNFHIRDKAGTDYNIEFCVYDGTTRNEANFDCTTDAKCNLGQLTRRFNNLYLSGIARLAGIVNDVNSRPTNANNLVPTTIGGSKGNVIVKWDMATGSMTSNKPMSDGYIQTYQWDNSSYPAQFFIPNNVSGTARPQVRTAGNTGVWTNWRNIALQDDISPIATSIATSIASNPNLLINSNFAINQRGETSYSTNGKYTCDRWIFYKTASSANTFNPSTKVLTKATSGTYAILEQHLEIETSEHIGETYTATINTSARNGAIGFAVGYKPTGGSYTDIISRAISQDQYSMTFTIPSGASGWLSLRVYLSTSDTTWGTSFKLNWAKLEVGSNATNYCPPEIGSELLKCQRYYLRYKGDSNNAYLGTAIASSATNAYSSITLPTTMRVNPTITHSSLYLQDSSTHLATALAVSRLVNNVLTLTTTTTSLTAWKMYMVRIFGGGSNLELDAEIY